MECLADLNGFPFQIEDMKRQQPSGHDKRKAKKAAEEESARLPKMTSFFTASANAGNTSRADVDEDDEPPLPPAEQSVENQMETESPSPSCNAVAVSPSFDPLPNDPGYWPEIT